jgi:hypothetical protein
VCESIDVRFLLEDMFAKIRKFGRDAAGSNEAAASPAPVTLVDHAGAERPGVDQV